MPDDYDLYKEICCTNPPRDVDALMRATLLPRDDVITMINKLVEEGLVTFENGIVWPVPWTKLLGKKDLKEFDKVEL